MLQKLFNVFLNKFSPIDRKTIDRTGMIFSDYPREGKGWIKGWLVNTPSRDVIIVCKHAAPSESPPNNKVFAFDKTGKKIERTIVKVDQTVFPIDGQNPPDKYYLSGDISVCKVDSPFPSSIKAYDFVKKVNVRNVKTTLIDQYGEFSEAYYDYDKSKAWIKARNRDKNQIEAGDSGTPWFILEDREWRVLTHSTRGWWGEGPNYGHPLIWDKLQKVIKAFSV
jgi:hypothetical protein